MSLPTTDKILHLMVVAFMGIILWLMQSMVGSMQSDRKVQIAMMDRLSALEVTVKQECE